MRDCAPFARRQDFLIIDTDVLIWFLRGNENAREVVMRSVPFSISVVTYMELVQGMRNKEELGALKKAISAMEISVLPITPRMSDLACSFVDEFFLSNAMRLADALIAATCLCYGEPLCTANEKHYKVVPNLDVRVFCP